MARVRPFRAPSAACLPLLFLLAACGSEPRQYGTLPDVEECSSGDVSCTPPGRTSQSVAMDPSNTTEPQTPLLSDSASASASAAAVTSMPSSSGSPGACSGEADCDDGVYCNGAEQCVDGSCQPGTAVVCDDGVPCTVDRCDELLGDCAFLPEHVACTDFNTPICDPVAGCSAVPCESDVECDDSVVCNGEERCNTVVGFCEFGAAILCDDAIDCTHDACSEATGACEFRRDNSLCDDGVWCNGPELCRQNGCIDAEPRSLDDGIPCTLDVCDEGNEEVDHIAQGVTLTITGTSNFGLVTVGEEICGSPPCSFEMDCGDQVYIDVFTSQVDGYGFAGWSSGGCGSLSGCEQTMRDDLTLHAQFAPANIAFTTSTTVTGDTGGLAGADAECQSRAEAADLSGTFRAWLYTSYDSPAVRFGAARGWVRPDGRPFADHPSDVELGILHYPLTLDEYGRAVSDGAVRTGAGNGGFISATCEDWTAASTAYADSGYNYSVGYTFQGLAPVTCNVDSALYCVQVDNMVALQPLPATGRLAFVSSEWFFPGGGISDADRICQSEATEVGLPGVYSAMLATSTASAGSRFDTSGPPWVRPDGIRITSSADQMFTADHWDTAPNNLAGGATLAGASGWSGGTSLSRPGTPENTCEDWTSTVGYGSAGGVALSQVQARHFINLVQCDIGLNLTCLQQ
jgi:hypothetical protein